MKDGVFMLKIEQPGIARLPPRKYEKEGMKKNAMPTTEERFGGGRGEQPAADNRRRYSGQILVPCRCTYYTAVEKACQ